MNKKHKDSNDRNHHGLLSVFIIMTGIAALPAGCGHEDAVTTDIPVQETISDMADVGTDDATDSINTTEDAADSDNTTAQTGEDTPAQSNTESQQNKTNEEQLGIDEETRQQLMTELLEEGELDVSVVESERATKGCTFDLPEGFVESSETDNLYVTERYPLDTSMIYYEVMDGDISLQLMTKDLFKEQAEESLGQAYGEDIVINIDGYESIKIDSYPAFRIQCQYEVDSIKIAQLEYIINADKTYVITYSQTSDYDWMEAFETSAATIHVK